MCKLKILCRKKIFTLHVYSMQSMRGKQTYIRQWCTQHGHAFDTHFTFPINHSTKRLHMRVIEFMLIESTAGVFIKENFLCFRQYCQTCFNPSLSVYIRLFFTALRKNFFVHQPWKGTLILTYLVTHACVCGCVCDCDFFFM